MDQQNAGRARIRARRVRSISGIAAIALAIGLLTALGDEAQSATAAPPPGYAALPDWTISTTGATALPGNLAAFGPVVAANGSPGQSLIAGTGGYAVDGVTAPRFLPSSASVNALATPCVNGKPVYQINTCATYSDTVTLPHPVVDPILAIQMGGGGTTSGQWCTEGWYDFEFSGLNGAPPAAGAITPVASTSFYVFDGDSLTIPQSAVDGRGCSAFSSGLILLQLHGLVSSYSIQNIWRAAVVLNPTGGAVGGSAIGGVAMNLDVPTVDLAIAKGAPATVEPDGTITWTIDVANEGPGDSHGFVIRDAVPAGVTDPALVSAPAGCELNGSDLVCAPAPAGCTAAVNPLVPTVADLACDDPADADAIVLAAGSSFGTITLTATAPLSDAEVENTATVSGVDSDPDTSNNTSTTVTTVDAAPAIEIVKSADPSGAAEFVEGQAITYSFVVTNTGNVPLTDVEVGETAFSGTGALSPITCPPAEAALLEVGAQMVCTATYQLTLDDVNAGSVSNTATATGTPPSGEPPVSPPSTVEIPVIPAPGITVVKSADRTSFDTAGQVIAYSFLVTNSGNVTLTGVEIDETVFTGAGTPSPIACPGTTLLPGEAMTCTASYTVSTADLDAGGVSNTATATGTPPSGEPPVSPPSTVDVPASPLPSLTVVKTAEPSDAEDFAVGQVVTYSFVVTNTGNVTLTGVTVDEAAFTGSGTMSAVDCPTTTLAPAATMTCTAAYTLTQDDVDAGSVINTATATGTPPSGLPPVSPPSTVEIPVPTEPGIAVVKTADVTTITAVGQLVTYSFLVTNTGDVTLSDVAVDDVDFSGSGSLSAIECPGTTLAVAASMTCTATYAATAADLASGSLTNAATATGTPPSGPPPVSPPSTVEIETVPPAAAPPAIVTTGSEGAPALALAGGLLLLGLALLIVRRRRA